MMARADCPRCEGTGISSTGPVDARCGECRGRGWIDSEVDDDDFDPPDPEDYTGPMPGDHNLEG